MGNLIFNPLYELSSNEIEEIILIDQQSFGISNAWNTEHFTFPLQHKTELSFYVRYHDRIVGYLVGSTYEFDGKSTAHINRIGVLTEFKKHGIGTRLVQTFLTKSRELKCLGASLEFNQRLGLQKFYTKNSFSLITEECTILNYLRAKNKLERKDDFLSNEKLLFFTELI